MALNLRIAFSGRHERILVGGQVAILLLVCAFITFSNFFDWDFFLSFNEVDRRSWLDDHAFPRWSYQMCSGVTRIADPQSLGLSPLFALVLVFGTFAGTKLAVVVSLVYGVYATVSLLRLFARRDDGSEIDATTLVTLSLLFVCGNFFVWHLMVGHLTFITFFFGLGIVSQMLKGFERGLTRCEFIVATLVTWQHYSGSFFHSVAYLILPFSIAFAIYVLYRWTRGKLMGGSSDRSLFRRLISSSSFHLLGILIASYRLVPVWIYQRSFPRFLADDQETFGLAQFLGYHFVPTWQGEWLVPIDQSGNWALHEYSVFSLLLLVLLGLIACWIRQRSARNGTGNSSSENSSLGAFVAIFAVVCTSLALGDFASFAPFTLVNRYLTDESVRSVGRFNIGVTLSMGVACVLMLKALRRQRLSSEIQLFLLGLLALNIAGFSWLLSAEKTRTFWALEAERAGRLSTFERISLYPPGAHLVKGNELNPENSSQMYEPVRQGRGIHNCYNPIRRSRPRYLAPHGLQRLIDPGVGNPGRTCIANSYYEQNGLHIDETCPQNVCVNVGWISPDEPTQGLRWNSQREQYCRL